MGRTTGLEWRDSGRGRSTKVIAALGFVSTNPSPFAISLPRALLMPVSRRRHGRASKESRGTDRWDDGDNCGYCVTGGRGEGREGGRPPSSNQTEKDSRGTTENSSPSCIFRNRPFRFFLMLSRRGSWNSFDAIIIIAIGPDLECEEYPQLFAVARRHVWLVFRICCRRRRLSR